MAGELRVVEGGDTLVALITCPNEESAQALSEQLVAQQAAACVNMVAGLTSVYRWQGEICRDSEWLLIVKVTEESRALVADILSQYHPYDEPELVFLPIHSGSSSYLSWLREQVSPLPRGVRGQRASNSARKEIED